MSNNYKQIIDEFYSNPEFGSCVQQNTIYVKQGSYAFSQKKLDSLIRIAELQKYYQCNPVKFIDDFFNIELIDAQAWIVQQSWNTPNVLLVCSRGFGKCVDINTRIPTPNGDKLMKDIKVGDYVYNEKGEPTLVKMISPTYYNHKCYELTFSDGESIVADAEHNWAVYNRYSRKPNELQVKTTQEMYDHFEIPKRKTYNAKWNRDYHETKFSVPMAQPIQLPEKELPIHPYILGLWLGDGYSSRGLITCHNDDLDELVKNIRECGYEIYSVINDKKTKKRITIHYQGKPLTTILRENNLYKNKHIPDIYLQASIQQRYELLQGLMDTDGTITPSGHCEFTQSIVHKDLTDGFYKLLVSLGIKFTNKQYERTCQGSIFYANRFFFTPSKEQPCFKIHRKYIRLKDTPTKQSKRKQIVSIKPVKSVPMKCISVTSEGHLYLCGEKNTVTHNSTLTDLIIMAKGMLFNNFWSYIASGSGSQAELTFATLERLANDNIDTMKGSSGYIFKQEVEIKNAAGDGFSHGSDGWTYNLFNGSMTKTLNSNVDKKRGKTYKLQVHYTIKSTKEEHIVNKGIWTKEEIIYLKNNYKKMTNQEIAKHLNRTVNAVHLKANRLEIRKEKNVYNRSFFKNITTEQQAYWLGFIYADGWIDIRENNSCTLGIELQLGDIDHLKKFNKSIQGNVQVKTRSREGGYIRERKIGLHNTCFLKLYSEEIVHDLEKYGVMENKFFKIRFPYNLPDDLYRHFIRGFFDGDGCISTHYLKKGGQIKCDFSCASREMLEDLRGILNDSGIKSYITIDKETYRLYIGGISNTDKFLHYLYDDATIYLERKFKKKNTLYTQLKLNERVPRHCEISG